MAVEPESESESEHEVIDEGELKKLETEVREMAKKISEYRKTLPDHLMNTLDSALSSSSHSFPNNIASGSDPLPSSSERLAIAAGTQPPLLTLGTEDQACERKMIHLKDLLSRNSENISKVVKRVRECVDRIHKLDSFDGTTIHPAFTRRRIN